MSASNITIALAAIDKVNEQKSEQLVDLAQAKITYIQQEQGKIAKFRKSIEDYQTFLKGLEQEMLTPTAVLGREPSLTPSPSEVTILNAIVKKNEEKAKSQANSSKSYVEIIDGLYASIKGCETRISELRKELSELTADVVTQQQILG